MKRRTILFWFSGLTLISGGCTHSQPLAVQTSPWRQQQGDAIREVFFRSQMKTHPSRFYFLQIGGKSPSPAFMARFRALKAVKPCTAMKLVGTINMNGKPVDRKTGIRGDLLSLQGIQWLSDTHVIVKGSQDDGGDMSMDDIYTLDFQSGRWQVTDDVETRGRVLL